MHNITEQENEMLQFYSMEEQKGGNIVTKTSPVVTARSSTEIKKKTEAPSTETKKSERESIEMKKKFARSSSETRKKPYLETDI